MNNTCANLYDCKSKGIICEIGRLIHTNMKNMHGNPQNHNQIMAKLNIMVRLGYYDATYDIFLFWICV